MSSGESKGMHVQFLSTIPVECLWGGWKAGFYRAPLPCPLPVHFDVVASQHSKLNQFEDKGYGFNKKRKYQNTQKHRIISFIIQIRDFLSWLSLQVICSFHQGADYGLAPNIKMNKVLFC